MKPPVLYTFRRCPYAIRARLALSYSQITVEIREVLLQDRPKQLYNISKKGTVPVLYVHEDLILDESIDIIFWALEQQDKDNWLFFNKDIQLNIISINDNDFKKTLDKYKYSCDKKSQAEYFIKCKKFLDTYEKTLEKYSYILSDNISLVDIALFPFVRQFAFVDKEKFLISFPFLNAWLERFLISKLFLNVMSKYETWNASKSNKKIITNFN